MRFQDKVAIITGAASGIGKATAIRLASEGAKVLIVDYHPEAAKAAADEITKAGGTALPSATDVGKPEQIEAAVNLAQKTWGKIDVVVNNAAMMTFTSVIDTSLDDWERLIHVNLRGPFLFCKYAIPFMPEHGAIVNVSSVHAHQTEADVSPYAASKGGLEAFTRVLAIEMEGRKIRVNCVAPGAVNTPMLWNNPNVKSGVEKIHGAVGQPQDLAAAIAFLASEEARFVTGTVLVVDGGRLDIL
jgi:NAD(P)-dependent dehydrogenase (short-subunit alcohol dehydrogenase family)